ncbi:MAG TPA: hemolysin family protein [Acidimicrobiia bacterium]|nr:hemolysin family protein [Acidimicrobiia bacterium]
MSGTQVVYLVVLGLCIVASGFFSGSETALISLPRERVAQLAATDRRGHHLVALVEDPDRMLSTLLVGNNFVNILGASIATVLFVDLLGEDWGPWTATGVVTAIVLLVGEITPKSIATRYPERFSLLVAPSINRLSAVLRPITRFFLALSRGIFRVLRIDVDTGPAPITEADIRAMALLGERTGDIEAAEREIIHSLFELADRPVRDVMTPRPDIASLSLPATMDDVRALVAATGHSRFPVVEEDLDHVAGILYVKDLLRMATEPGEDDIRRVLRTPSYVPESKLILELLQELRERKRAFVLVLDEHGGVEGLVTIKDLVAELVGELQDEYDPGSPTVVSLGDGSWIADGRLPVDELGTALGTDLPAGPYATVAGLVLDLAGRIPNEGDAVMTRDFTITVMAMDRRRVDRVRIQATPSAAPDENRLS